MVHAKSPVSFTMGRVGVTRLGSRELLLALRREDHRVLDLELDGGRPLEDARPLGHAGRCRRASRAPRRAPPGACSQVGAASPLASVAITRAESSRRMPPSSESDASPPGERAAEHLALDPEGVGLERIARRASRKVERSRGRAGPAGARSSPDGRVKAAHQHRLVAAQGRELLIGRGRVEVREVDARRERRHGLREGRRIRPAEGLPRARTTTGARGRGPPPAWGWWGRRCSAGDGRPGSSPTPMGFARDDGAAVGELPPQGQVRRTAAAASASRFDRVRASRRRGASCRRASCLRTPSRAGSTGGSRARRPARRRRP